MLIPIAIAALFVAGRRRLLDPRRAVDRSRSWSTARSGMASRLLVNARGLERAGQRADPRRHLAALCRRRPVVRQPADRGPLSDAIASRSGGAGARRDAGSDRAGQPAARDSSCRIIRPAANVGREGMRQFARCRPSAIGASPSGCRRSRPRSMRSSRNSAGWPSWLSVLSPTMVAQGVLLDVAGTSTERFDHFRAEASSFQERWQAYFEPRVLDAATLDAGGVRSRAGVYA